MTDSAGELHRSVPTIPPAEDAGRRRVAIVGLGIAGDAHWHHLWSHDDIEVVAVCRSSRQQLEGFRETWAIPHAYIDLEAMLESVPLHGLVIATPHDVLASHLCLAAAASIPVVLVEKPVAATAADVRRVAAALSRSATRVSVGYNRRYRNHWKAAAVWVREGRLGHPPLHGVCQWSDGFVGRYAAQRSRASAAESPTFRNDPARAVRGVLLDSGSHLIDGLTWIAQTRIRRVTALLDYVTQSIDHSGGVILETEDGGFFTVCIFPSSEAGRTRSVRIEGALGRVDIDDDRAMLTTASGRETVDSDGGSQSAPIDDFARLLRSNGSATTRGCTLSEALATCRVIDAVYRSKDLGRTVDVEAIN